MFTSKHFAQTPFAKLYTNVFGIDANNICATKDNGAIVSTSVFDPFGIRSGLIKIDSSGNIQWARRYAEVMTISQVLPATDTCYYFVANHKSSLRMLLVKLNAHGDTCWARSYADSSGWGFYPKEIIHTLDSGLAVCGTLTKNSTNSRMFVLKLASDGNIEWIRKFDFNGPQNFGYSLKQRPDSTYFVSGFTSLNSICYAVLLRISPTGNILQCTKYDSPKIIRNEYARLELLGSGCVMFYQTSAGSLLMRADGQCNITWGQEYNYTNKSSAACFRSLKKSRFIFGNIYDGESCSVINTDTSGTVSWSVNFLTALNAIDLAETGDGGILFMQNGPLMRFKSHSGSNFNVIKSTQYGVSPCLPSTTFTGKAAIVTTSTAGATVTQNASVTTVHPGYLTELLSASNSCVMVVDNVAEQNPLKARLFPNPATDRLTIESVAAGIGFELTDIYGNKILSGCIDDDRRTVDVSGLAPGIYLYNMKAGNGNMCNGKLVISR